MTEYLFVFHVQKQQTQLKNALEDTSKSQKQSTKQQQETARQIEMKNQQENNLIEQLRLIVSDKENQIKSLEEEMKQMSFQVLIDETDVILSIDRCNRCHVIY